MRVRFSRWSGTQEPLGPEVSADQVLDALQDDLLDGVPPEEALARLLRQGLPGAAGAMQGRVAGLEELRRRVEQARRRELDRLGVEGPLRALQEQLEQLVERERFAAMAADDEQAGARRQQELDELPQDVAQRIERLRQQEWLDRDAREDFDRMLEQLRREVAQAVFGRLAGALGSLSPDDLERMRDMLAELNALAARQRRGEDVSQDFAGFQQRYGDLLPDGVETLDQLLEELARRMAAMSGLLAGLDARQRAELAALAEDLLGDLDLSFQADQLGRTLRDLYPELAWDRGAMGAAPSGDADGGLSSTVDWMERLQQFEDLGQALRQDYPGARMEDIDERALRAALGEDAARDLRALKEIERLLEEAGALRRRHGRLELTPRGLRRLGERALGRIFARVLQGEVGGHRAPRVGGEGEPTGSTRPYAFGDPFRLDISKTVANAILRQARERGSGAGVRLAPGDFELAEAERRVRTTTVLLLDMSFSMPLRGNWDPAKRMTLALSSLVASKFPEDRLHVVGFSDYARRLQPADLLTAGWERVYGTNMQHAFLLARRLLGERPGDRKQIIMVTDGEPTAHLEGQHALFSWPPTPETLSLTMAEGVRLARAGVTMNVFLLDHDPGAAVFVEQLVRRCGGRIFYPDPQDLGEMVVKEFLS